MPIDPTVEAASLIATPQEISPVEQQNRYGGKHRVISELEPEKVVTVLAIQTTTVFSTEQFFEILTWLQANYGVETMQTAFACEVPSFGDQYYNDLHLSAHLRAEQRLPE